jgi:hypothetical protein
MARKPSRRLPQHQIIERTANDVGFRDKVVKALSTTRDALFQGELPTFLVGFSGQYFYYAGTANLAKELAPDFGFELFDGPHDTVPVGSMIILHCAADAESSTILALEHHTL